MLVVVIFRLAVAAVVAPDEVGIIESKLVVAGRLIETDESYYLGPHTSPARGSTVLLVRSGVAYTSCRNKGKTMAPRIRSKVQQLATLINSSHGS